MPLENAISADDLEMMEIDILGTVGPVRDLPVPDDDEDEWHFQEFGDLEFLKPSSNDTTANGVLDEAFDDSLETRPAGF